MLWLCLSLGLFIVVAYLNLRQARASRRGPIKKSHTAKPIASAAEQEEWQQIIREVQRHMHVLCMYREDLRIRIAQFASSFDVELEERLICEIADHMALVNRAHRLMHEPDLARKQTDPEIIMNGLKKRCRDSEALCQFVAETFQLEMLQVASVDESSSLTRSVAASP